MLNNRNQILRSPTGMNPHAPRCLQVTALFFMLYLIHTSLSKILSVSEHLNTCLAILKSLTSNDPLGHQYACVVLGAHKKIQRVCTSP